MLVSVIIPTHGRPDRLRACVQALARQDLDPDRFEVLIGVDGPEQGERQAVAGAARRIEVHLHVFRRKRWQAAVRNDLLERARGRVLVFLNDDMLPEPSCLRAHLDHQLHLLDRCAPALIIGDSPWKRWPDETVFDRMIRWTSMVFFHDQMPGSSACAELAAATGADPEPNDPGRCWGFRHAWLLNLSCPAELARKAGGFTVLPGGYGYEDDEFAFRLRRDHGVSVLFRPEASAVHDHRLTPASYLEREHRLGASAWGFAGAAPACASAMFGRDIRAESERGYAARFVEYESGNAERLRPAFEQTGRLPASVVDGRHGPDLVRLAAQQHLLLKRWTWRRGYLESAGVSGG